VKRCQRLQRRQSAPRAAQLVRIVAGDSFNGQHAERRCAPECEQDKWTNSRHDSFDLL
jgi:hypothetical protein